MTPLAAVRGGHCRRRLVVVAAVGVLGLLGTLAPGPGPGLGLAPALAADATHGMAAAVQADPDVQRAEADLVTARALARTLNAELDEAARSYEGLHAHALRLEEELGAAEEVSAAAEREVHQAEERFAARIAAVYKRPSSEIDLAAAVLGAGDTGTALHRAALLSRVSVRSAGRLSVAESERARLDELERQRQVIEAGVLGAASERRAAAEQLSLALGTARARAERATAALGAAQELAQERELERRHAAARSNQAAARSGQALGEAVVLPAVDGKVCPVGGPHGFIDSWGFPRSGGRRHQGVDMFAAFGTPLAAVADGVVRRVGSNRLGGLYVDLVDREGNRYYYAHLSEITAVTGQRVVAGTVVGAVGDSGNARGTPPHLHWQFHPGGGPPVNPHPLAGALCRPGAEAGG